MTQKIKGLALFAAIVLISACGKDEPVLTVFHSHFDQITSTVARMNGAFDDQAGAIVVTSAGFCYSTSHLPDTSDTRLTAVITDTTFSANATGLTPGTKYYVRSYGISAGGLVYSPEDSFQTLALAVPTFGAITASNITITAADIAGSITADGGQSINERGFCMSTQHNPDLTATVYQHGTGTGSFTENLTGLTAATTYYVRMYVTNITGTFYSPEFSFSTIDPFVCVDQEGHSYPVAHIGNLYWMTENLSTGFYKDGTPIPYVTSPTGWAGNAPAYCYYNNSAANKTQYGHMYNYYAVSSTAGFCPTNWHVPNDTEWQDLTTAVGGTTTAGTHLKAVTLWGNPGNNDNSSGFTAYPGGLRTNTGLYTNLGTSTGFWSATGANAKTLNDLSNSMTSTVYDQRTGFYVRCVHD